MPLTEPNHYDWIEVDNSGPLVEWCSFPDLDPLRGRALRGGDITIPAAPGVYSRRRTLDALWVDLTGYLHGDRDRDGAVVTGFDECSWQLEDNRRFFIDEVFDPPAAEDGQRTLSLHIAGGDNVYTGPIVVDGELRTRWYSPVCLAIVLPIVIVDGELALIGS